MRDGGTQPLSSGSSASQAGHVGGSPSLVDEDQTLRIEIDLLLKPILAPFQDVRTLLFRRVRGLLNVMRRRAKKRHRAEMLNRRPRLASFPCNSASVMSGFSSTQPRIREASTSIRADRRSPPCGFDLASPVSRSKAHQRIALEALTPNRAAASRRDMPSLTAAITRSRRSIERALAMHAGLLRQHAA